VDPIDIPFDWKRFIGPRRLSSPQLSEVMWPSGSIIPQSLHLRASETNRTVDLFCRYPVLQGPDERDYLVGGGRIILFERTGLLYRLVLPADDVGQETYAAFDRLLQTFLIFARTFPLSGGRKWYALFSAEIMNEFWKGDERILRALFSPAPYR
jgi:hypothetical protein